jgi:parallel beta-helix repeat protein
MAWRTALVGLLLCAAVPLRAATYVVDPAGDDAADGSPGRPWRTIRRAAAAARAGDLVVVHPGTYMESVAIAVSGTAMAPIEYRADPGAVLESPDPAASLSAFDLASGVGHVVLDGFVARGGFHETVLLRPGAHDVALRHCELYGNRAGIWIDGASDVTVEGCSIHDNTRLGLRVAGASRRVTVRDTLSAGNDDGRGCAGDADGFSVEPTSADVRFIGCRAQGNAEDGFDVQGDTALLAAVESRDNGCTGLKLWQNARVENALVTGNTTGVATSSFFGAPIAVALVNTTVADNRGTQIMLGSASSQVVYAVALRNVIGVGSGKVVEVEWPVVLQEDHDILFRPDTTSAVIARHLDFGAERRYSGQEINAGTWAAESGQGRGTLAVDPDFTGPAYRVASDSAAVDRGEATDAPPTDRADGARPLGGAVDIGPDEIDAVPSNHRPWADPGPQRTVNVGTHLRVQGFGSIDPDGDALTYAWDFGDGSPPADGYAAQHAYAAAGDYTLSLTVSDGRLLHTRATAIHVRDAAAPTPTATPASGHDSEIRVAPRRVRVRLAPDQVRVVKRISIVVRNADARPQPELPGHVIQVVTDPGDCPALMISTPPSFAPRGRAVQDRLLVAGGHRRRAAVLLAIDRALLQSPDRALPLRCHMRFIALGPDDDPTPENNVGEVEIELANQPD